MISIIVCSVSPDKLKLFKENIANTIGVQYEIIAIDNQKENLPITTIYNIGAEKAEYPYLCFAHEDIAFHSNSWGEVIIEKLKEQQTGVIGFAGSAIKTKTISAWNSVKEYTSINLTHTINGVIQNTCLKMGKKKNGSETSFEQVITLDGLCLFSRREVWKENKFDDENFNGFHLYDVDFAFAVSQNFKNYVCFGIDIEHFSNGSYNNEWLRYTRVFHKKWENILPASVENINEQEWKRIELHTHKGILYFLFKKRLEPKYYITQLKEEYIAKCNNIIDKLYIIYMFGKYNKKVK